MQQRRLWELLGKKLAGEAREEELAELQNLLSDSPGLNERVEWIETFWNSTSNKTEYEERESALEKHMLRMRNEGLAGNDASRSSRLRTRKFQPGKSGLSLIGVAAAVLLFVGIRFFVQVYR